jgi:integrase
MKVTIRQKSGMQYLYADISVSGIRIKCTLGISIREGAYNNKKQIATGENAVETNILISEFKNLIMDAIRNLQRKSDLSKETIVDKVKAIKQSLSEPEMDEKKNCFISYIENGIEQSTAIRKESTIKQYVYCLNKYKEYQKARKMKLTFDKIDYEFYNDFLGYNMKKHNLSTNSIGKLVKNIKMWMGKAHEEGLHSNLIFKTRSFKKPVEEAESVYLSEKELQLIRTALLPKKCLENVRDLFLLACYTGVRSQDYHLLNKTNLINNGTMFKVRTEKTDEEVIIPVHPIAKAIIEKYNGVPRQISNQKFNQYIKEICEIVGINESISITRTCGGKKQRITRPKYAFVSSHTARRSFATNAYKSGMPSLSIMAITGHRTEKVFLKYIRVTKEEHAELASNHSFFLEKGRVG